MSPVRTLSLIWRHPANRGQRLRAIGRYAWWQAAKRLWLKHYDLPYHGLLLRCWPDSHSASAALYFSGLPDYREMQFLRRFLRPGDCFVDVGANVGVYTLLAASLVGRDGVVHAFEPVARTFARLTENVAINRIDHVHCHSIALSHTSGQALLDDPGDDALAGLAATGSRAIGAVVACATLDDVLPDARIR